MEYIASADPGTPEDIEGSKSLPVRTRRVRPGLERGLTLRVSAILFRQMDVILFRPCIMINHVYPERCSSNIEGSINIGMHNKTAVRAFKPLTVPPSETPAAAATFGRVRRVHVDNRDTGLSRFALHLELEVEE